MAATKATMIRCPNCSSVLPEREGVGLEQCPQCRCDLDNAGLPPLPGFDTQTPAPAQRSQTLFGLAGVDPDRPKITRSQGFPIPAGHREPSQRNRSSTAPLPGLTDPDNALPGLPGLPDLSTPRASTGTGQHHVIDFGQSGIGENSGLSDLPTISLDLPALSNGPDGLPGANLPSPSADLPALSESLPALSESLPAVSNTLPGPVRARPPGVSVPLSSPPPPPPGSARYQRPGAGRASAALRSATPTPQVPSFDEVSETMPAANEDHLRGLVPPASAVSPPAAPQTRDRLKRALARKTPPPEAVPGIGDLDLDLEPAPSLPQPGGPPPAQDSAPVLPEDLPETVAALEMSALAGPSSLQALPAESGAISLPRAANAASPAPRVVPGARSRWPLIAGGSLLVCGVVLVGAWQLGVFEKLGGTPEEAVAQAAPVQQAEQEKPEPKVNDPETLKAQTNTLAPRAVPFVAALKADTPLVALTLAQAQKDRLGEIEATLYYAIQNADPTTAGHPDITKSSFPLQFWQQNPAPFVQRVVGLDQLYRGEVDQAVKTFAAAKARPDGAEDPLLALYGAIASSRQGKLPQSVKQLRALAQRAPELKRAELLTHVYSQDLPAFAQVKANTAAWEGLVAQAVAGDAPASHAFSVASTLQDQGRWAQAHDISKIYLERAKSPAQLRRWRTLSARILADRGETGACETLVEQTLKDDPHSAQAAFVLWDSLYQHGAYAKLRRSLNAWLIRHPKDIPARIMLARSLAAQGDGALALMMLTQLDQHLIKNKPLAAPLTGAPEDAAVKSARTKAESLPPEKLMAAARGLAKVTGPRRRFAAASALARAEILARRTALGAAVPAFEIASDLAPLDIEGPIMQAKMFSRAGQFPRAMAVLEGAQAKVASQATAQAQRARASWLAEQASLSMSAGKTKKARRRLAQAHVMDPLNPHIELSRAHLLKRLGQEKMAEASYAKLAQRTGGMPGLLTPMTQIYLRRGDIEKLDALLGPKLKSPDAPLDTLLSGARLRIAQNQLMPALALAGRAIKLAPDNWEAHLVKAQVLLARGEIENAQKELTTAQPKRPTAKYELWMGKIKDAKGDFGAAYGHYRLAASLDRSDLEPRVLQAKILARRGSPRKAITMLKPVLKSKKANADVFLALGIAHRDLRKPKKAIAFFKRAQSKAPDSYVAYYEEGRIASNHNRHPQVIRSMDKALAANAPAMPTRLRLDALRRLGRAYLEQNNYTRAEETLTRYLIEAPRDEPGRAAVERMMESL